MSEQSAFEKRYVDPKDQSSVEGLLEHFNLPPKFIAFLRNNKKVVQAVIAVVILSIVSFSLYGSYRDNRIESAATALALALKEQGSMKIEALSRVAEDYANTSSGTWARLELAHQALKDKDYDAAAQVYGEVNSATDEDNPLFALTLFGQAQTYEAQGDYEKAYAAFDRLKSVEGYQLTGYTGLARVLETQGEFDKALGIYGQYLTILNADPEKSLQKTYIEEKIARLKARQ